MIELKKAQESLKIVLEKKNGLDLPTMPVTTVIDCSGSMEFDYKKGYVQQILEQMLAVALKFDDDGQLPVVLFSNNAYQCDDDLNINNIENYLKNQCDSFDLWGITNYLNALKVISRIHKTSISTNKWLNYIRQFTRNIPLLSTVVDMLVNLFTITNITENNSPTICFFITDGEPSDDTDNIVEYIQRLPGNYFWQFVLVGTSVSQKIRKLEQLPNVSFVSLKGLNNSNDVLYENIITSTFVQWAKDFK